VTDTSTTRVEKPWGYEDILERNQDFVVKRILLRAGNRSSLQVHERKREWVEVVEGTIELTIGTDQDALEKRVLSEGDVYRVPPGTIHRVLAVDDALILEICTPGDDDIIRLDDDYGRRGQHATRATWRDKARGLWTSPRDHLAALVLVFGLLLAGLLVAFSPAVSLPALNVIHGDGVQLHEVAQTYVAGWESPKFDPFVDGRLRLITVLLTLVYMASVTALGSLIVGRIRGAQEWSPIVRILAAFLPGYLMAQAPLQLLYAAIPYVTASWIGLAAVTLTALAVHRETLRATPARLRGDAAYRRRWLRTAYWVGGLVLLTALWRLQAGRNFMVSDSITVFLNSAQQQLGGTFGRYLGQWDQQSDEWLFSAPLMFTSHASRDFQFPLYATQVMALVSFAALLYGIVRTFAPRRKTITAALSTGIVLAGSPAIHPIFYISLFGGQNPTWWVGHAGRYVGILAPWVALLLIGRLGGRRAIVAAGFAFAGLGFTSLHVTVYVVVALGMALLWPHLRDRRPALFTGGAVPRGALHALAALALATPAIVYGLLRRVSWVDSLTYILLAGAVLGMVAAFAVLIGTKGDGADTARPRLRDRTTLLPLLGWVGVLLLGFVLSNNLTNGFTDGAIRDALGTILPGYDAGLSSRGLLGETPLTGLKFATFSGQECWISGHCLSIGGFIGAYGFVTIVAAAGWLALGRITPSEETNRMRAAWLVMVATLCVSFLLVDFMGANQGVAWIITRFIEVPYYGLLVFGTIVLVGSRDRLTAIAGGAVIGAWTIVPVLYNLVPLQLVKNADWLVGLVSK
jgi:mannose-6-phosphate isomerase-like protein (cupin superfamily)